MNKKVWTLFALLGVAALPLAQAQQASANNENLVGKTAPGVKETLAAQADVSVEAVEAPKEAAAPAQAAAGTTETGAPASEAGAASAEGTAPQAAAEGQAALPEAKEGEGFVAAREELPEAPQEAEAPKVTFNPKNRRDPTLSPDDFLLLQYREQQRLAALEAERQRKLAEERRRREEAERQRQLELARIKDPTREVRNKIRVTGIIGNEIFIGSKIYTIGNSIYGARIVEVRPEEVVFSYKGHKFVRKVQLN